MTLEDATNTLNVEFGYTKDYCPVTLANKGVLLRGDYLQAVKYEVFLFLAYIDVVQNLLSCWA
jgi:hypothetical protein